MTESDKTGPPLVPPTATAAPPQTDATGGLIPYKNVPALVAYYLGIFSLIPCLGLILGLPALILGIIGLKRAARQPEARGKVHAWVGIILGGLCAVANLAILLLMISGAALE